jgi:ribonuclease J
MKLTFYSGVREIGGNKIFLEDGDRKLFLDFGYPYNKYRRFYEEYLKPRPGAGLLDLLVMKLLPPVEGLYRGDLETPGLWEYFRGTALYRRVEKIEGVLLSHAHLDHSGHISFLREEIPVYATLTTAFIAKAVQDSGKVDFDQQVCYFTPRVEDCLKDWRQGAFVAGGSDHQRRFRVADSERLSEEAKDFWGKAVRQKKFVSQPLGTITECSFKLRCFPVDHSILGACAWGVETGSGWVVYSGDLRLHGKRGKLTELFVQEAARLHPKVLILEGTNVGRATNVSEQAVYHNALKAVKDARGLVIADFPARDMDRLLTFLRVAKETGRNLVILPRDAYLLDALRLIEPEIPDPAEEDTIFVYQETTASRSPASWLRDIYQRCSSKVVLARDISSNQGDFVLRFSFLDLNELPSIYPAKDSLYLYSSSEPHTEEQQMDFRRLRHWLEHFEMRGFGLPVEKNGQCEVPEAERGLHASGHACGTDLLAIVNEIRPQVLIPVHCEAPQFYRDYLAGSGIHIIIPQENETIEL